MNAAFNRWQLGNTYGAFGTVTKQRIEIVVEGTLDAEPDDGGATGGNTGSAASPATSAGSRASGRRTTCAWTG